MGIFGATRTASRRPQFADAIAGVDFGPRDAHLEDSFDDERFNTPFVAIEARRGERPVPL